VGIVSTVLEFSVLVPVLVLCVIAAVNWHHNPFHPFSRRMCRHFKSSAPTGAWLWLYSGYEQCSERCRRNRKIHREFSDCGWRLWCRSQSPPIFCPRYFHWPAGELGQMEHGVPADRGNLIGGACSHRANSWSDLATFRC